MTRNLFLFKNLLIKEKKVFLMCVVKNKNMNFYILLFLLCSIVNSYAGRSRLSVYKTLTSQLKPLHQQINRGGESDWLANYDESGQTFKQYLQCDPRLPTKTRRKLYIQPIGKFSPTQRKIMLLAAEYMGLFYNSKIVMKRAIPLSVIPNQARRTHPRWGDKQLLSTYILDNLLEPILPDDATAIIAFTASDLWPGKRNYVFGQASRSRRVGVWSMYRFGDPDASRESYDRCLMRTIKLAVHETGHMFSIKHCTLYECVMCGCNNLAESDRRPVWLCPEGVAKVCWATRIKPSTRYIKLLRFWDKMGYGAECKFFQDSLDFL